MTAAVLKFDRGFGRIVHYADGLAVAAALQPERPVFCFSRDMLTATLGRFRAGFPGEVAYAVKANSSEPVLTALAAAGLEVWDVASVEEMALVRAAGARHPAFHYHNPVKSQAEIASAYETHGCRRFAVDCEEELEKIAALVHADPAVSIAVRFVLPRVGASSAHDFSTKFGATPEEAAELLKRVAASGYQPVLTFHPGSQCSDISAYRRHIGAAAEIARMADVKLAALNAGGGFPVRYVRSGGPELEQFFAAIAGEAATAFGADAPKLECEPGRGLVATCVSLLTRVKTVRAKRGDVFLNDGIYGALMEVSQVPDLCPPHRVIRGGEVKTGATRAMTVFGPTCDPLDRLPGQFALPEDIREGDYVEFGTLGAYGFATMTRFNGFEAHETVDVRRAFGL